MVTGCLRIMVLVLLYFLKIETEAQNRYSLNEIMAIAKLSGKRLEIIDRFELAARADVEAYRSEAWPSIQLSSGLSYINQSIIGQGSASTDISRVFERIDGYNIDWTLSIEQPLLTFGRTLNTLKLARLRDKAIGLSKKLQKDNYFLEVVQQFITAFAAQYDYSIYSESVKQSTRIYERVYMDFKADRISRRDLLFMEAAMRNDKANLIKSQYKMESEKKYLAILTGLDSDIDSLYFGKKDSILFRVSELEKNKQIKSLELKLKELEVEQNRYQKRYIRTGFFPSLNLTGSIQNNFVIIDTSGLTARYLEYLESTVTPIPDSIGFPLGENPVVASYFDPDYFSYAIGLRLNWNIFNGKKTIENYRQIKYITESSRLELEQMTKEFKNDISDISGKLFALDSMISSLELQFKASEMAVDQAKTDLINGFINVIDYVNTIEEHKSVSRQLEGARLQYLVTKIQLRIAMGLSVYEE